VASSTGNLKARCEYFNICDSGICKEAMEKVTGLSYSLALSSGERLNI
jgi:hypothetical protein